MDIEQKNLKSSSTSSLFLSSTINSPNIKLVINSVANIIHSQILEDGKIGKSISPKSELYYFSEEKYFMENPHSYDENRIKIIRTTPTELDIAELMEVKLIVLFNRLSITVLNSVQNVVLYALFT